MRRVLDAQGRSRAHINGRPATLAQLEAIGELLIDLHGQHAHQSLGRPETQRRLLDAYGGFAALAREVALAWRAWQDAVERANRGMHDAAAIQAFSDGSQVDRIHIIQKALDQGGIPQIAEVSIPGGAQVLALNGADTAVRKRVVWQVRTAPYHIDALHVPNPSTSGAPRMRAVATPSTRTIVSACASPNDPPAKLASWA